MKNTEERIVTRALEMFNQNGIEYVGMRELAAALDTKLGNITYYFPTKEDLILRLATDLSALNSAILQQDENISLKSFFEMTRQHFECQLQYRCLFLSFVHLMNQYEKLSTRYKKVEEQRKKTVIVNLSNLTANKYLKELTEDETSFLLSSIVLIARFWISEAALSHSKLKPAEQIQYYLRMMGNILLPYSTAKGKAQLLELIQS